MANIGDLVVHLDADTRGLERGLDRGQKSLQGVNKGMQTTMGIARRLTGALAAIGVGLSISKVVTQFADFEQGMTNVGAVAGSTAEEMDRLENSALRAAASTRFNPAQTTQALYALASSGQAAQEQISTLPNVLNLAEAGQANLGQSTELLTSTLNQFSIAATDSQRVADVFVASIGASALNVNRLQVAFRNAGPTAAAMGQSLEQTTAALGMLTTAFGNGERAGTGFRAILNELGDNADDLGISVKDSEGNFVGLVSVLQQLEQQGVSASQIVEMFGAEAGPALAALLSQGSEALQTMEGRMQSTGQAAETAGKQLDTLRGDLDALASSVDVAFVEIGRSQEGVLRGTTQTVTNLIRLWSGYGDELGDSRESTELLSAAIITLSAAVGARAVQAIGSLIIAKSGLTAASLTLTGAITGLRTAASLLFGPVGVIVGGLTLLYQFRKELGLVPSPVKDAREEIELLTGAIEDMNRSNVQSAMVSINAQLFDLEKQAREAREEMERINNSQNVPGPLRNSMVGPAGEARQQLTGIQSQQRALQERMDQLREFDEGLAKSAASANEASKGADALTESTNNASKALDEFSAQMSPEVEDILDRAGEGSTIDANGILRDAWGNALPTLQRELDRQMMKQINDFSAEQNLMKGLEAAAQRFVDGASTAVSKAWNSIRPDSSAGSVMATGDQDSAPELATGSSAVIGWSSINPSASGGLMPTNSQSSAPARAMQSTQQGSGKNLGTLKLASEKGGTIDVEANSDRLAGWLANTLSGNAAAS